MVGNSSPNYECLLHPSQETQTEQIQFFGPYAVGAVTIFLTLI
jgi:hypothetical protein